VLAVVGGAKTISGIFFFHGVATLLVPSIAPVECSLL
jgi:hypothetical protein